MEEETKLMPTEEGLALLRQIADSQKKQERYTRWQYRISVASACACVLIAVLLLIGGLYVRDRIQTVVDSANRVLVEADTAIDSATQVLDTVKQLDLKRMTESITKLAEDSTEGVSQALKAMDEGLASLKQVAQDAQESLNKVKVLDIDALNKGIKKLNEILEPMARLFNINR